MKTSIIAAYRKSQKLLVWRMVSTSAELTRDKHGCYFLETPKQPKTKVTLKESAQWYAELYDWEQEGEDYGEQHSRWLHDLADGLPGKSVKGKLRIGGKMEMRAAR